MTTASEELVRVEVYVPETHLEAVKQAMFAAGAGQVGDYDCCAWQTLGQGQYRPLQGSRPHQGETGQIETVAEYKIELVCPQSRKDQVVAAMKSVHPYEEVAYGVIRIES